MSLFELLKMFISSKREQPTIFGYSMSVDLSQVSLDAAGLVALADLSTIARRTALTGTSTLLDAFVLCPGLHRQTTAPQLNQGEYPACAALTTGYVFRVENPATVLYLQKVGRTGQLTTLSVKEVQRKPTTFSSVLSFFYSSRGVSWISTIPYFGAALLTVITLLLLILFKDWWGLFVISLLMFSRLCNVLVIRARSEIGWKGAPEPGVNGDLLILLSQDRWIRMHGAVDDLKTVTSGQWLRDPTFLESSVTAFATVLVYLDVALTSNTLQSGKVMLLILLIGSAGLLAIANEKTEVLQMHGRTIQIDGARKRYPRRLVLAEELIKETGRDDWAIRLGMINSGADSPSKAKVEGPVTM